MRFSKMWCAVLLAAPLAAAATGTSVRFDLSQPNGSPFPSDRFTKIDWTNKTYRRVNLPKPDCTVMPSDCADIDVINTLDGFNTQPRITVPFSGPIDPASVNSDTVYLVNLGDVQSGKGFGHKVGINQVVWDAATNTLIFESDELLAEHSRYLLVVTTGVRDAAGKPIEGGRFGHFHRGGKNSHHDRDDDHDVKDYGKSLRDGMHSSRTSHHRVAALSVFTTQSATADLRKIHRQIKRSHPAPVNFSIANGGAARAVFPLSSVAGIQFQREVGVTAATPTGFAPSFLPTPALDVVKGAVAAVAFGKFTSPDYQTPGKVIPATGTQSGHPRPQGSNELVVELFVPAGDKPAGGWPVAIFGHGFTDSMYGAPWTVASVFASKGIATMAINVVGHGGGAKGTLNVIPNVAGVLPTVVPAGGRGIDQDGNGAIDSTEGVNAAPPATIVSSRDGLRQTVIDLMQLVRQVEVGVDVDGDGHRDLDKDRIYYAGQSFGGIYGTILLGVEDGIKAGVPNVPGGSITEVARLGAFRFLTAVALATRQPQLLNLPPTPGVPLPFNLNFNENMPLRGQPTVINTVPGATAIQQLLERNEWVQQSGNPVSYASMIRKDPPRGHAAKSVLIQYAKGDVTVPNPTSSAIVRAGDLADRAIYFRNDLAYAANPQNDTTNPGGVPKNPHTFLTNIGAAGTAPYAVMGQTQIAIFFATNGGLVVDPDGPAPFYEVPLTGALPEGLNFIP
ncbi:MAG: hypothetical protein AD742_20435 [Methylibium sp. NZG]|nr:MAG: hypothetical protein AD742_20435 [Methylibium sp. NZG]